MNINNLKQLKEELCTAQVNYDHQADEFIRQAKSISAKIWTILETKFDKNPYCKMLYGQQLESAEWSYHKIQYSDRISIEPSSDKISFAFNYEYRDGETEYHEIHFPVNFFQLTGLELDVEIANYINDILAKYDAKAKEEKAKKLKAEKAVFESLKKKFGGENQAVSPEI